MQLYAFWRPAPIPLRITKPCNRLLEASHDPAEVIRQMRAGPLSDVVGQAVKDLLLLVETDCVAGHVRLELGNVEFSDGKF